YMSVAAELYMQIGTRQPTEVGSHDGDRPAKERKWRLRHSRVLERQQCGHAVFGGVQQQFDGIEFPQIALELGVSGSTQVTSLIAPESDSLFYASHKHLIANVTMVTGANKERD